MQATKSSPRANIIRLAAVAFASAIPLALAVKSMGAVAHVIYTVDPAQSSLVASGTFEGQALQPQYLLKAGPTWISLLIASCSGTIVADRDTTNNTIQFVGGNITASNYEFATSSGDFPPSSSFRATISNFSFSLSSAAIGSPTSFDVSQLSCAITSGELEYIFWQSPPHTIPTETDGASAIGGQLNLNADSGSLTDSDGIETIKIPINTGLTVNINGSPLKLHLSGTLVATTPEPTCLILCFAPFLAMRRRCARNIRK